MAEEKNFLQTIKLDISRSFKLVPYERLAFHKILGILKSDIGMSILIKELDKGPDIRRSAIAILAGFEKPEVFAALVSYLKKNITDEEKVMILDHIKKIGNSAAVKDVIEFIETFQETQGSLEVIFKAFEVLKIIGMISEEALNFLISKINSDRLDRRIRSMAIESLSSFKSIAMFENLLKKGDDDFCYSAYKSIYSLALELADKSQLQKSDDDRLFTYSPDTEDKVVLDVRVLLGKMTHSFDSYSNRTKIAFICAMIACNHREYLIYTMKTLTSSDTELVSMVLYSLYQNINRLRDPDKLFRNLIAISTEMDRFNEMIVDIFVKYFSAASNTRQFNLLKDKLYSYIVVTLETYFETYRKEFMITDVIEKGLPESFQRIRKYILNNFTPDLKREILSFLTQDDSVMVSHLVVDMAKRITYIDDSSIEDYTLLIEVLMDKDKKSRENSSSRIEDLNFEKLYLRNRIIRLCRIIGLLQIDEAASVLVNIYNYLKKYPDKEILEASINTLSMLNYSYMLGEIEVMITTGTKEDQKNALRLLSLFTEQRSLNILLEFLKNHIGEENDVVESALTILLERDISGNITAEQIFKGIIAASHNQTLRSLAILGIGEAGFDSDIDYLDELFYKMAPDEPKDVIVRAIANIIRSSTNYNKRQLTRYLQEYLKDPGIKVRIYSCLLLAQLGNRDALRSIRDMLIIKNKSIQRDILTILGDLRSIEFTFFLISLLKEEYGISKDIIPVISKLPLEEMKEIDGFVVNIFRKFEAPTIEGFESQLAQPAQTGELSIDGLKVDRMTILNVVVSERNIKEWGQSIPELINTNLKIKSFIASVITEHGGVISKMSNANIISIFSDTHAAAVASLQIANNIREYNTHRIINRRIEVYIQLVTETVKIINDEIIEFPLHILKDFENLPFKNKIIIDAATQQFIAESFSLREIPQLVLSTSGLSVQFFEVMTPINFAYVSEQIIKAIRDEEEKRDQMQQQLEDEMKKLKRERRSASSAAIARELDDLGHKLQNQLEELDRYVQKRSTDRELIKNVRKMLSNIHNMYKVEISRIIID